MRTHYDNLQVSEQASAEVIRASYKALVQKWHPDRHLEHKEKAERYLKIINNAYDTLSDANERGAYDRWLKTQRETVPKQSAGEETIMRQEALNSAWRDGFKSGLGGLTPAECTYRGDLAEIWHEGYRVGQSDEARSKQATSAPTEDELAKAWRDGHRSFKQGSRHKRCPYAGKHATAWRDGFNAAAQTDRQLKKTGSSLGRAGQWVFFLFLFSIFVSVVLPDNVDRKERTASQQPESYQPPQLPLPATGYSASPVPSGVAPLTVKTSTGTNYYIKLQNAQTHREIASFFIRSGETLNVNVPVGRYEMKYATWPTWYGPKYLFGSQTAYSKAKAVFDFSFDGYRYSGYTVELIQQAGGNLSTGHINPSQW